MGRKKLLKECDDPVIDGLIDEIDIECDNLRRNGIDLTKIKISPGKSYTMWEKAWMREFDEIRRKLLRSGKDLSKIPIAELGVGMAK